MNKYGNKGKNLLFLRENGCKTPPFLLCEAFDYKEIDKFYSKKILDKFLEENFLEIKDIVIRSSSLEEDSLEKSNAGIFTTFLYIENRKDLIKKHKEIIERAGKPIPVIIQKRIEPDYSGVAFSVNPQNYNYEVVINYGEGIGENIVSGKINSNEIKISRENSYFQDNRLSIEVQKQLFKIVEDLEKKYGNYIDLEWCCKDEELYILQIRDITTLNIETKMYDLNREIPKLNQNLLNSEKIRLRAWSKEYNFKTNKSFLLVVNSKEPFEKIKKLILNTKLEKDYAILLIKPHKLDKIERIFVGKKFELVEEQLKSIIERASKKSIVLSFVIQKLEKVEYTGLISKRGDRTIVEVGRGVFTSKGIVPMNRYEILKDEVVEIHEVYYNRYFEIEDGRGQERICNKRKLIFNLETILNIERRFRDLLNNEKISLEFGVTKEEEIFGIDFITMEKFDENLDNIIIGGKIKGKVVFYDEEESNIELHYHDNDKDIVREELENVIVFSKLSDIGLLKYINRYSNKNLAFVFENASMLAHLSILIRENNITSLNGIEIEKYRDATYIEIDSSKQGIITILENKKVKN